MKNEFMFLLSKKVSEKQILTFLEEEIKIKLDSYNFRNADATGYVLFGEYSGDIRFYFILAFPENFNLFINEEGIAVGISKKFKAKVLYFNPDTDNKREYLMFNEKGEKYAVNLEDEYGSTLDELKIIDVVVLARQNKKSDKTAE